MYPPEEWLYSRIMEEFPGVTPLTVGDQPLRLCIEIMEDRAYAAAKHAVDTAQKKTDLPDMPMIDMVMEIAAELFMEARAAREKDEDGNDWA